MSSESTPTLEQMRLLLVPARHRVAAARLRADRLALLRKALPALTIAIAGCLAARILLGSTFSGASAMIVSVVLVTAAGTITYFLPMVTRRAISFGEAAERLDAKSSPHNRIATALDLLVQERRSPFALSAIETGWQALQSVESAEPSLPCSRVSLRHTLAHGGAIIALLVSMILLPTRLDIPQTFPSAALIPTGILEQSATDSQPASAPTPPVVAEKSDTAPPRHGNSVASRPASASPPMKTARRGGLNRSAASGQSAGARQISAEPTARRDSSHSAEQLATTSPRQNKTAPARAGSAGSESQQNQDATSAASISGSGSGAGQTLALANRSDSRDQSGDPDASGDENEQKLEDQNKGNQQRGGVQPSLPDRTAAPSRELGITGPESGKPGTGRGGPSPAKKSRGVASLLMGVALPDFVQGKTGPGPAAVTFEEIEPIPSPEATPSAATATLRTLDESPVFPLSLPWAERATVQKYLVESHSRDRVSPSADPGRGDAPARTSPSKAGTP